MNPSELYRAGRLSEAIDAQIAEVKTQPADQGRRLFLFELLAFAGELERAKRQVDAVHYGQPDLDLATLAYSKLVDSEVARRKFFTEGVPPEILGETTEAIQLQIEAVGMLRLGKTTEAQALLDQAIEATPPLKGTLNGKPFTSIRDGDDRFGGVLEVMAQGKYFWIALEQVVGLGMSPPSHPRDLIYFPARLDLLGEAGEVFLPVLYPDTYKNADDQIRFGRVTDWSSVEEGPTRGIGSRLFLVDEEAVPLLEWRQYVRDDSTVAGG